MQTACGKTWEGTASTGCGKMPALGFRVVSGPIFSSCSISFRVCVSAFCFGLQLTPRPAHYIAGASNRSMRSRFSAAAAKRNIQSTRRRPRNFVCRNPAACLSQPNTCSTRFRFFWLRSNPGSFLSSERSQLGHCWDGTAYSATCGTTCRCRKPGDKARFLISLVCA